MGRKMDNRKPVNHRVIQTNLYQFLSEEKPAAPAPKSRFSLPVRPDALQALATPKKPTQSRSLLTDDGMQETPRSKKSSKKNARWESAAPVPEDAPTENEVLVKRLRENYPVWDIALYNFFERCKGKGIDVTQQVGVTSYKKVLQMCNYLCGRPKSDVPLPTLEEFEMATERLEDYCHIHHCYPCYTCIEKALED